MSGMSLAPIRRALAALCFLAGLVLLAVPGSGASAEGGPLVVLTAKGAVTPVMAGYIDRGLRTAEEAGASAVIVQLDTPGGLDSSMRDIIQRINGAPVPVVVYVSPAGARAASAGAFITMAAHVASMAPNTAIGAAHPVAGGGEEITGPMADKVTNDAVAYIRSIAELRGRNAEWAEQAVRESISATADGALEQRVVDLVAADLNDLVRKLDGRRVKLLTTEVTLDTTGIELRRVDMNPIESFLAAVADPNVAYMLLSIAMLAIFFELSNPGALFPGILGGLCLLLALFALGMLPVNVAGLLFMGLGFILFIMEVWIASHGVLGLGGALSLLFGSLILMSGAPAELQVDRGLIAAVVGFFVVTFLLVTRAVMKTWRRGPAPPPAVIRAGTFGVARTDLDPDGTVLVNGELWRAHTLEGLVRSGQRVIVTGVSGLELEVMPEILPAASPLPPGV